MEKYILSIDQGTTSTRAIVFDKSGRALGGGQLPHRQIYPRAGWVSHDAEEIYTNVLACVDRALDEAGVGIRQIAAVGLTNQRETVVAWDRLTGKPACHAVVWQCRRTEPICRRVLKDGAGDSIRRATGLPVDPYFSATKLRWILDNEQEAGGLLKEGRLLVGTVDSFILWRLSGGEKHITDHTNASRTMLFNINTGQWDGELLRYFGIPREILPEVVATSGVVCETSAFGGCVPVGAVVGDQHAALFGQRCFARGAAKCTYGTGCFLLVNTGGAPVFTDGGLLTTVAWHMNGETTYALEGSIFNCGAAIDWLINEMGLARDVDELNDICARTPDTGGVTVVAALSGLGAPHWDMAARGAVFGMSLSTNRSHVVKATVESIAFQVKDVLECMCGEAGFPLHALNVDGGVSRSDFLMQFQADILGIDVERPAMAESTALGAALLAGLAVSYWKDAGEIEAAGAAGTVFHPAMSPGKRDEICAVWREAVGKVRADKVPGRYA